MHTFLALHLKLEVHKIQQSWPNLMWH
jgi:hypothetical protein